MPSMEYRRVGSSGLVVSEIGLGSWLTYGAGVDADTAHECIRTAFDAGVIFFDTADVYNKGAAEELLGKALAGYPRSDLVIATKAYFKMSDNPNDRGLSRKHLFESAEKSLARLRTDYLDLFQCHRHDATTPVAETVRAMDDLVRAGKILYWGISCWGAEQIAEALSICDATNAVRPISHQPQYNLLVRDIEHDVIPLCEREGIGQVVFSPLAEGILTGKYRGGAMPAKSRGAHEQLGEFLRDKMTDRNLALIEEIGRLADEAGMPLARLALAWTLRTPAVASAIIGASRPEQIRENVVASGVTLDEDLLARIDGALSAA